MEGIDLSKLSESQKEYVIEYQRILDGLMEVQKDIESLENKAKTLTKELNILREKEKAEFGENNVL